MKAHSSLWAGTSSACCCKPPPIQRHPHGPKLSAARCDGGMTTSGADRSGPRVQCSVHRASGTCDNAARYYVSKIERLVVDALRIQLEKPELIKEYVKTYREERNRIERAAR